MRILIMNCSNSNLWYSGKVSERYIVQAIDSKGNYKTKDGVVLKKDAAVIGK
ncbi:hypothetical protein KQI86_19175 [Clostridium sp. MSJ-11]|uniref:Uncharacterized protein n=1 Tax=Clostridium mobile TaxID=2841512 RepID=A0ABS6EMH3_9CLOT|nr:hypothetical protein [Clostridium mobile]MBU5486426.1 hypothetical protein [Clostridium mobile]